MHNEVWGCTEILPKMLLDLKKAGKISDSTYKMLYSSDGLCPRLYGLSKIHKPGIPLRPIVSFVNSPTYAISEDASLGQRTSLPVVDIIHLLSFCLKTTQFTYVRAPTIVTLLMKGNQRLVSLLFLTCIVLRNPSIV